MVFNTPSPFSTHEWMTIPFEGQVSNAHHKLANILLVIPHCIRLLGVSGSMRAFFASSIPSTVDTKPVEQRAQVLLEQLDTWAKVYPHLSTLPATPDDHIVTVDMSAIAIAGSQPAGPTMAIPASFIALTAATYEATRLILILLLLKLRPPAPFFPNVFPTHNIPLASEATAPTFLDTAVASSQSILRISHYMESTHPVGFDIVRSVFPLVVAGLIGPRWEEVHEAQIMLERWGKMKGMGGLCSAWLEA